MADPRRWARRAVLSALAGSGLTAAGLGPFGAAALGSEAATAPTGTTENPPAPVTETTPQAPAPEDTSTQQQTTPEPTTTTSTVPAPSSTTTTPPAASTPAPPASEPVAENEASAPTVVVQRKQRATRGSQGLGTNGSNTGASGSGTGVSGSGTQQNTPAAVPAGTPNGVAPAPQAVGGEAGTLASLLAGSAVSAQALAFYRIPLFLLPIYQAAAIQYDVPWQILAAINEVETDYGTDLSVSTAGAVGWMQFMPETWLQYGVDATAAGYADPYNPVDAIFAAARYLHAAGAAHNMRQAILAYNHSQAYLEAVMLRARLIARYPRSVIATLTGLVDGRLPTAGARVAAGAVYLPGAGATGVGPAAAEASVGAGSPSPTGTSSATAGAVPASPLTAAASALHGSAANDSARAATAASPSAVPGSTPPPPPQVVAARAEAHANAPAKAAQLIELVGTPGAAVVAVQNGRVVHLGHSHALGRYLVLRDIYGDVFTYADLGSVAPRYRRPKPPVAPVHTASAATGSGADASSTGQGGAGASGIGQGGAGASGALPTAAGAGEPAHDPTPTLPASAGHQPSLTLKVKAHTSSSAPPPTVEAEAEAAPMGMGKVRLYAHPGNPIARAAAARAAKSTATHDGRWLPLRTGSLVTQGTVLGHLTAAPVPGAGQLRFAVRPADDNGTIDPRALLANWRQLGTALHPKGSKHTSELLGATADDVFAMAKSELQSAVLSDPGIQLDACARRDIAAGAIDRRVLAVLEFLSRSGLQPTVGTLRCARSVNTTSGPAFKHFAGDAVDISAVNGIPIAGHQGPGTITDTTIRALLTLRGQFAPKRIVSLMEYPETPSTFARAADWDRIHIDFGPVAVSARTAKAGKSPTAPLAVTGNLSQAQWDQLIARVAALPQPTVAAKPSSAAIGDPQAAPTNRGLGARGLNAGT